MPELVQGCTLNVIRLAVFNPTLSEILCAWNIKYVLTIGIHVQLIIQNTESQRRQNDRAYRVRVFTLCDFTADIDGFI